MEERTVKEAYEFTVEALLPLYGDREAGSIAAILFEELFGWNKMERVLSGGTPFENTNTTILEEAIKKMRTGVPVQYVLGYEWFSGMKFFVNEHVLIPRQETEELCALILKENKLPNPKILDIGTGSGCIAISLAAALPKAEVHGIDISRGALDVAKKNNILCGSRVKFSQQDVFEEKIPEALSGYNIIVSNPPYITESEKDSLHKNVVENEPHLALFVADNDPLLYYKRIAILSKNIAKDGATLCFEINEKYGNEVAAIMENYGYKKVMVFKDLNGKDRIVKGMV